MAVPVLLLVRALTSGGSERQLTELAKALDRGQWEPHVGCLHDSGPRAVDLRAAQVPIVRFPVTSFTSPSMLQGVRMFGQYVRNHGIRIVHSFDSPMNLFGVFAARFYRCPIVLSSQRAYRSLNTPRDRRLLRITDRLVNGVVVNCEAVRKHLIEDEHVPAGRIHLCYNGIDSSMFFPREQPRPSAVNGASLVIGCACVLRPEKGLSTLLEAFASVLPDYPHIKLALVGSGPMLPRLQQQAEQLGIIRSVHFEPATAEVADWMRAMDMFVLPSLSEALSNSLMEAMLCGCAVVASQVGGNPELAIQGKTGLTFPSGDAPALVACLRQLIEDEARRKTLGEAGRDYLQRQFSIEQAAARMSEIYSKFLEG